MIKIKSDPNFLGMEGLFRVRFTAIGSGKLFERSDTMPILSSFSSLKDKTLVMGIDQSTSCTGICIGEATVKGFKPILLIDVINNYCFSREIYLNMFEEWLYNNMQIINPRYVVYEEVGANASQTYARRCLLRMVQVIMKVCNRTNIEDMAIGVNVWRKYLLKDDRYDGRRKERSKVKAASQEEVTRRHPELEEYFNRCHRNLQVTLDSVDSVDAYGIANGFCEEYFFKGDVTKPQVNHIWKPYPEKYYDVEYLSRKEMEFNLINKNVANMFYMNDSFPLEDNYLRCINYTEKPVLLVPVSNKMAQTMRIDALRPDLLEIYAKVRRVV